MTDLRTTSATGATTGRKTVSVVAAVLGSLGVLGSWMGWPGIVWGVPAIVVGHIAQRKEKATGRPWWITGLVTGYLSLAIGILVVILAGMLLASLDSAAA